MPELDSRKIAIVYSDDQLYRFGLAAYCELHVSNLDLREANLEQELPSQLDDVDLLILDLVVGGRFTFELIEKVRKSKSELPILVVCRQSEMACAERALVAGANGYLNPRSSLDQLPQAITLVLSGEIFIGQQLQNRLLTGTNRSGNQIQSLTSRELDVFFLLGMGNTTKEIAGKLELSVKTIETYREKIKQKLGFTTSQKLTRYALEANVFHFHTAHSLKQNRTRDEHQKG